VSVTSWDGQNHKEHWNNNHSNPLQMQNAHLVTRTYEILVIQIWNTAKDHTKHNVSNCPTRHKYTVYYNSVHCSTCFRW